MPYISQPRMTTLALWTLLILGCTDELDLEAKRKGKPYGYRFTHIDSAAQRAVQQLGFKIVSHSFDESNGSLRAVGPSGAEVELLYEPITVSETYLEIAFLGEKPYSKMLLKKIDQEVQNTLDKMQEGAETSKSDLRK